MIDIMIFGAEQNSNLSRYYRYHCEIFRTVLMYQPFIPRHTAKFCANCMTQKDTICTTIFSAFSFS